MPSLLIVESPAKAKSISTMLGAGWRVRASFGHVRDLPAKDLGIDRKTFAPSYTETERGAGILSRLKSDLAQCRDVYFATDPDREGEAIAWHLAVALGIAPASARRVTYHEITETAIRRAIDAPRKLDLNLVDAQQARRMLDRIVGYTVSPHLWRQSQGSGLRLSAGRVQTPALRLVVERDRAIDAFRATKHYSATLALAHPQTPFEVTWDTKPFIKSEDEPYVLDRKVAESAASATQVRVLSCVDARRAINAPPPFTTSALQQAASAKLGISPGDTMKLAQMLFETHHAITYHRTDSVHLADEAIEEIRKYAATRDYPLPDSPNKHTGRSANAQEAHEAIRPTDPFNRDPAGVRGDALKLYHLIHDQAVASQLAPCRLATRVVRVTDHPDARYQYEARGQTIVEPGCTVLTGAPKETHVPSVQPGDMLTVAEGRVLDQQTKPPARYTEGSLVRDLEKRGIGRPSTWAAILDNIKSRGYILIKSGKVHSTPVGAALVDALVDMRFAAYDYTAALEEELDGVAKGESSMNDVVAVGWDDLEADLAGRLHSLRLPADLGTAAAAPKAQAKTRAPRATGAGKGQPRSASKTTGKAKAAGKAKTSATGSPACPVCGGPMKERKSARGPFYGCANYPTCRGTRPA